MAARPRLWKTPTKNEGGTCVAAACPTSVGMACLCIILLLMIIRRVDHDALCRDRNGDIALACQIYGFQYRFRRPCRREKHVSGRIARSSAKRRSDIPHPEGECWSAAVISHVRTDTGYHPYRSNRGFRIILYDLKYIYKTQSEVALIVPSSRSCVLSAATLVSRYRFISPK